MPLIQGASDAAKSANIRQLIKSENKPQDQAVAIAMDIAKRSRRAEGGGFDDQQRMLAYRPLNFRKLREAGALRVTQPGDGAGGYSASDDPEQWSMVTPINDRSLTQDWPDKPASYGSAETSLNQQPGPLYDGKYRQILAGAAEKEMPDAAIFQDTVNYAGGGQVANALNIAKRTKRAEGGIGLPKLELRAPMPSMKPRLERPPAASRTKLHIGPIHSGVAGRTDHLPMNVPNKAYVLPADIVSGMGEGNTIAGFKIAKELPDIFHRMLYGSAPGATPYGQPAGAPYGHGMPSRHREGGAAEAEDDEGVPIIAAGGEHVYSPSEVAKFGNGDVDLGHDILDAFVKKYRAEQIKTLQKLPGPKRD